MEALYIFILIIISGVFAILGYTARESSKEMYIIGIMIGILISGFTYIFIFIFS